MAETRLMLWSLIGLFFQDCDIKFQLCQPIILEGFFVNRKVNHLIFDPFPCEIAPAGLICPDTK